MADIIQLRRDTADNWAETNPVLAQGELALEIDTRKLKIGNGVDEWNDLPYNAGGIPTEEQIAGTVITASVSGAYNIDWNAATQWILTMTGDTVFSDVNLAPGKVISIQLTGDYLATFQAYYEGRPSNDSYDGAVRNEIEVNCKSATPSSENVTYGLENLNT